MGVWLEEKDVGALSSLSGADWSKIRDGCITEEDGINRPTFGFRIIKPFKTNLGNQFLRGMQGQILRFAQAEGGPPMVLVETNELFNKNREPLKDWVHVDAIERGYKPYGTWKAAILHDKNSAYFAKAVLAFLKTLLAKQPICFSDQDKERLGENGRFIDFITAKIIEGARKAGVLHVLNNPESTIEQLVYKSTFNCIESLDRNAAGIYIRRYIVPNPGQTKKGCVLYAGQSRELISRAISWKSQKANALVENANSVEMKAICILPWDFYISHCFIVEQVFVSLLETYRASLVNGSYSTSLGDTETSAFKQNYLDLKLVADGVSELSGWRGFVSRKSSWEQDFDSCQGLNVQSPLSESHLHTKMEWYRVDACFPAPEPDDNGKIEAIRVANFSSSKLRKFTVTDSKEGATVVLFSLWENQESSGEGNSNKGKSIFRSKGGKSSKEEVYRFRMTRTPRNKSEYDGYQWPKPDTFFTSTFEVRLDGKPHPYAWARLPLIGTFEDWDRANSWGFRIGWKDPGGKSRSRYIQCEQMGSPLDSRAPGSLLPYARGIEIVRWLFKEDIPAEHLPPWIGKPPLMGDSLKIIKHDHVKQLVTFNRSQPTTTKSPTSSGRHAPETIRQEMQKSIYKLTNIGLSVKQARANVPPGGKKFGTRRKCDTCLFRSTLYSCYWEESDGVCRACRDIYGRPFCSWSVDVPPVSQNADPRMPGNDFPLLFQNNDHDNIMRRKALVALPLWGAGRETGESTMLVVSSGEDVDDNVQEMAAEDMDEVDDEEANWFP